MANNGWRDAWAAVDDEEALAGSSEVGQILAEYRRRCWAIKGMLGEPAVDKDTFQTAFNSLVDAVQANMSAPASAQSAIHWRDTHDTPIARIDGHRRNPSGGFFAGAAVTSQWYDMVAAVEIKESGIISDNHQLRGQLLQDFADMADIQPRRFMLGLTLAGQREVKAYICIPAGIYIARVGDLPLAGDAQPTAEERRVVAFLVFMLEKLRTDYGFLTASPNGLLGKVYPKNIVHAMPADAGEWSSDPVYIMLREGVLGRHQHLKGQRTWLYPRCWIGDSAIPVVAKFQWAYDGNSEVDVHQFVLRRKIPHVPELKCTATVDGGRSIDGSRSFKGELALMEDVGSSIWSAFGRVGLAMSEAEIIDLFAGYAHTIIAAARVQDGKYVLHRDISVGNLMVKPNGCPYVIDWGYGCVCTVGTISPSTGKDAIGTAIFMGIRILLHSRTRSVVDDLESLFLVFCYCLWGSYGKRNDDFTGLWTGAKEHSTRIARKAWLGNKKTLIASMEASGSLPKPLQFLAENMYDLLFPASSPIYEFTANSTDPWVSAFKLSEWLGAFESAAGLVSKDARESMRWIGELREYVEASTDSTILSVTEPRIQSAINDADQKNNIETPARHGSKRPSDSTDIIPSKMPRQE
ncbi:hypothetical protein IWW50_000793 [Coemansia erecta]|nr:hypothetical protein IWW50_000793 [Coemansia erecta]